MVCASSGLGASFFWGFRKLKKDPGWNPLLPNKEDRPGAPAPGFFEKGGAGFGGAGKGDGDEEADEEGGGDGDGDEAWFDVGDVVCGVDSEFGGGRTACCGDEAGLAVETNGGRRTSGSRGVSTRGAVS